MMIKEGDIGQAKKVYEKTVTVLSDWLSSHPVFNNQLIMGLSGGIDSALVATLASEVVTANNLHLFWMPTEFSTPLSFARAQAVAEALGVQLHTVDLQPALDAVRGALGFDGNGNLPDQNLQARLRMVTLMYHANMGEGAVLETSNRTEYFMGYYTVYGDGAGAVSPIAHLYKSEVYQVLEAANSIRASKNQALLPMHDLMGAKPSAELCKNQEDEDDLPATYDVMDRILEARFDGGWRDGAQMKNEIRRWRSDISPKLVDDILIWADRVSWKKSFCPPILVASRQSCGIVR